MLRLAAVLVVLMLAIGLLGWYFLRVSRDRIREDAANELQAISDLKTASITEWREERLADARIISEDALLADDIAAWLADPRVPDLERKLRRWMESIKIHYQCGAVILHDAGAAVRLETGSPDLHFQDADRHAVRQCLAERETIISDLYAHAESQKIHQDIYIPIRGAAAGPPLAVIQLVIDPDQFLFPNLRFWPTSSRTAESLLVRRDGNQLLYLNELRHQQGSALKKRLPIDLPLLPAAMAVRGVTGAVDGEDYRGRPVLAYLQPVPDSGWFLVCKADRDEVYQPYLRLAWRAGLVMLALVLFSAFWVRSLWKHRQVRWELDQQETLRQLNASLEKKVEEQTSAIQQSFEAAERERRKLYEVLETLPAYVALLSSDYHVPFANRVFRERFGEPRGRRCYEFLFGRTEPCETCETYTVLKSGKPHHWEWTGPDAREYDVHDFPFTDTDGSPLILEMGLDVTKRKRAEAALRELNATLEQRVAQRSAEVLESETRFHALFAGMTEGFALHEVITDAAGKPVDYRFLEINPAFERITGLRREDVVGRTVLEVLPKTEAHWIEAYGRVALTGEAVHFDQSHAELGRHFDVFAYRPAPRQFAALFMDITDRKHAEEALNASELRYRRLFESAQDGILILDAQTGMIVDVNPFLIDLLGFSREVFLQKKVWELGLFKDIVVNQASFAELQQKEYIRFEDKPLETADGRKIDVEFISNMYLVDHYKVIQCNIRDITDRRRTEESLRLSEARFRIALKNSPITVAALDRDLRYTWVYNTRHGFDPGQVLGRRPDELVPPEDAREIMAFLERALSSGVPEHGIVSGRTRGEEWVYDIASEPLPGGNGDGTGLMIALIDITERARMEQDLLELERFKLRERSQKEWQTTFDFITDPISIHDRNGRLIKANRAFMAYFGLAPDGMENPFCHTLFSRLGIAAANCPMLQTLRSGAPETREISDPAQGRILEISTFPHEAPDGSREGCIHVIKDITSRKESEMQLIMNERLAALGQMAAGIAHEINNPLATISGCAEGLSNRTRKGQFDPALFADYLRIIDEEIVRCKAITSSMLSFVRRGNPQRQVHNAREVLDRTLELIGFQGRLRNVELLKDFASWVEPVLAAETELKQVFVALLSNALDAMNDKGTLAVAMGGDGRTVRISIRDSGPGVPPHLADRIFDPFFTTKQGAGGTGLGLPIARRIVESMGGSLELSASPGGGALFTVTLPRAEIDAPIEPHREA